MVVWPSPNHPNGRFGGPKASWEPQKGKAPNQSCAMKIFDVHFAPANVTDPPSPACNPQITITMVLHYTACFPPHHHGAGYTTISRQHNLLPLQEKGRCGDDPHL